jgi:hypothetical protein
MATEASWATWFVTWVSWFRSLTDIWFGSVVEMYVAMKVTTSRSPRIVATGAT